MRGEMKVIFLDVDGVLNSRAWAMLHGYGHLPMHGVMPTKEDVKLDPSCVARLHWVVKEASQSDQVCIVVSSSWRYGATIEQFQKMFELYGWPGAPVIDMTPISGAGLSGRGVEVERWLDENAQRAGVVKYVCIDDDADFLPNQHLVRTNPEVGFTMGDANAVIEALQL